MSLVVAVAAAGVGSVTALPSEAQAQQAAPVAGLIPEKVRTNVPVVVDGAVSDVAVVGSRVVVAGTFTQVKPTAAAAAVTQRYLMAYDLETGAYDTGFVPVFDGPIEAIESSTDGNAVYVVGNFNTVSGVARKKVVKLSAAGAVDPTFVANANSKVTAVEVASKRVYIGGKFTTINSTKRGGLAAVDAVTGAVKANFDLPLAGGIGFGGEMTVKGLGLVAGGAKLAVSYTGQTIGGVSRVGAAIVDLSGAAAVVTPWHTRIFEQGLAERGGQLWSRGFDVSPDGSYFVITTSGGDAPPINDMVIALPTAGAEDVQPMWLSRHFDSVYSAAIDTNAVYIGGHFRYQEAPGSVEPYPGAPDANYSFSTGPNGIGAGVLGDQVVARGQLGALDPVTGKALSWNPGSDAFNGVTALTIIPRGLLLGHDGVTVAGKSVGRAAFFDRSLAVTEANDSWITAPLDGGILAAGAARTLTGRAVAPSGVAKVQVTVQNRKTKAYLQPNQTWAAAFASFNATLGAQGVSVTWSLPLTLPVGSYEIRSRVFGKDATKEADQGVTRVEVFDPNNNAPNSTVLSVEVGGADGRTVTIRGTATDDFGIAAVKLALRNATQNAHLQPNGTLGSYYEFDATLDQPGQPGTNWSFTASLPDGQWYVESKALDSTGLRDGSPGSRSWSVFPNDTPPAVTLTAPAANAVVVPDSTIQITGNATDDRGVAAVRVYLQNTSTYLGMVGAGVLADRPAWIDATLSTPNATSTAWTLTTPPLPAGQYNLLVYAVDTATQPTLDAGRPRQVVEVVVAGDARPAAVTMTSPQNAPTGDPTLVVSGTAADDRGVREVRVSMYANVNPAGWVQADGTISPNKYDFIATLAAPGATTTGWSITLTMPQYALYSVLAYSVDSAGQPSNPNWRYPRYVVANQPPTLTVAAPAAGQAYTGVSTIGLNGTISDDLGVDRVMVYFNRPGFWEGPNPAPAGGAPGIYDAFVTNPGGKLSNWSMTSPKLDPGPWSAYVIGRDSSGQDTASGWINFTVGIAGDAFPVANIDAPVHGKADFTSTSFTISGRVSDDKGVASVAVRILQPGGGFLKPGGGVAATISEANWATTLATPGATQTTWSMPVTVPAGQYYIYAISTDSAGQRQVALNWGAGSQIVQVWVTPGDASPTNQLTKPLWNTTVAGAPFTVEGTATDDRGITNAYVLIRRTSDHSTGLRNDGTIGVAEYVPATLASPGATSTTYRLTANIPAGNWEIYTYVIDATTKQAWAVVSNVTVA